jgi:hypothetical protein
MDGDVSVKPKPVRLGLCGAKRTEARFEREGIVKHFDALVARFVARDGRAHAVALRRTGAITGAARCRGCHGRGRRLALWRSLIEE